MAPEWKEVSVKKDPLLHQEAANTSILPLAWIAMPPQIESNF
jgi:hypothetical protein